MSQEYCCECGNSYASDEVFDINIFNHSWTKWCFNCAAKQLNLSNYRLVHISKSKKNVHIQSIEEQNKKWQKIMDELWLCAEKQNINAGFYDLSDIAYNIVYKGKNE